MQMPSNPPIFFWVPWDFPTIPVSQILSSHPSLDWEILSSISLEINAKTFGCFVHHMGSLALGYWAFITTSRNWQHLILLIYRHRENWELGMHIIMTQDTNNHSMYTFQQAQHIYNYMGILWIEAKIQSRFEKLLFWGKGLNILLHWALVLERNGLKSESWGKTSSTCMEQAFYLAKPTPLLTPLASLSILVEMTCPKGFSIFSSSCSSIEMGRFEMYRFVGSCSCC